MGAAPSLPVLTLEIVLHDFGGVFGLVVLLQNTFRDNKRSFIFLKAFFVYSSFSHLPKTFALYCISGQLGMLRCNRDFLAY